jgi:hypothetical protein
MKGQQNKPATPSMPLTPAEAPTLHGPAPKNPSRAAHSNRYNRITEKDLIDRKHSLVDNRNRCKLGLFSPGFRARCFTFGEVNVTQGLQPAGGF